jgi:thioredoxin-like negative regulator of GroEL
VIAIGVLAVSVIAGLLWRARGGRVRVVAAEATSGPVTLLQFSSPTCAPCDRLRAVCETVAAEVSGVRHVEVDVAESLDEARAYGVWRVPTLLVVDAAGQVVRRTSGVPDAGRLREAVREVVPAAAPATHPQTGASQ